MKQEKDARCWIYVDRGESGKLALYSSERCPTLSRDNKKRYKQIIEHVREKIALWRSKGELESVVIDVDSSIPFEHVIGVMDALRSSDIREIAVLVESYLDLAPTQTPEDEEKNRIPSYPGEYGNRAPHGFWLVDRFRDPGEPPLILERILRKFMGH
jgi:hypothetical protein